MKKHANCTATAAGKANSRLSRQYSGTAPSKRSQNAARNAAERTARSSNADRTPGNVNVTREPGSAPAAMPAAAGNHPANREKIRTDDMLRSPQVRHDTAVGPP